MLKHVRQSSIPAVLPDSKFWLHLPPPTGLAQSKERKGSNFAIWQHCWDWRLTHLFEHDLSSELITVEKHLAIPTSGRIVFDVQISWQMKKRKANRRFPISVNFIHMYSDIKRQILLPVCNIVKKIRLLKFDLAIGMTLWAAAIANGIVQKQSFNPSSVPAFHLWFSHPGIFLSILCEKEIYLEFLMWSS